jgi:hypothetical protein
LAELVKAEALPWRDVLHLIQDLAEELQAARDDGTLPRWLSPDQVWIQADGSIQLVDSPEEPAERTPALEKTEPGITPAAVQPAVPSTVSSRVDEDELRALALIREVARMALEGGRSPSRGRAAASVGGVSESTQRQQAQAPVNVLPASPRRIRAAVPERASVVLERLAGVRLPFPSLESLRVELDAAASQPLETSTVRRGIHLAIQGFFLLPGLFTMFFLSCVLVTPRVFPWDLETVVAVPIFWVLWAILARGGLSLPLAGLALVRGDGRSASRLACGWRAFLVWAPLTALLAGSRHIQETLPEATGLSWGLWIGGIVLLLGYIALALSIPSQGVHDRLAGTVLVPI